MGRTLQAEQEPTQPQRFVGRFLKPSTADGSYLQSRPSRSGERGTLQTTPFYGGVGGGPILTGGGLVYLTMDELLEKMHEAEEALDDADSAMLADPNVVQAVEMMEDAYERADDGEDVDWDHMIDRYGVG